ncbi:hypothetical protein T09_15128 [Trichinella sp. T9]|nr:hypothetical protein T09_15128 [Trichinella sp. T9]
MVNQFLISSPIFFPLLTHGFSCAELQKMLRHRLHQMQLCYLSSMNLLRDMLSTEVIFAQQVRQIIYPNWSFTPCWNCRRWDDWSLCRFTNFLYKALFEI